MRPVLLSVWMLGACAPDAATSPDTDNTDLVDTDPVADTDGTAGPDTGADPDPTDRPGLFVALGDGGRWATSGDGLTWDDHVGTGTVDDLDDESVDAWRGVTSHQGVIVRVGGGLPASGPGQGLVAWGPDGQTWTDGTFTGAAPGRALRGVAAHGEVWVAVGDDGSILRSTDNARTWQARTVPRLPDEVPLRGVAASRGVFVAVGGRYSATGNDAAIVRSVDGGLSWSTVEGVPGPLFSVASNGRVWVAVAPERCVVSSDGLAWDDCGLLDIAYRGLLVRGDELSVAFKTGQATTVDGRRWTRLPASDAGEPDSEAVGAGRYVGLRYTQRGVSIDRAEWTWTEHLSDPLRVVAFHPDPRARAR